LTAPGIVEAHGLVLDALGERPRLQELTVEPPGPGEVRIRMRAAGLCHTDVSQVRDARFTPILLGHEGAGVVETVGEDVQGLTPGDAVLEMDTAPLITESTVVHHQGQDRLIWRMVFAVVGTAVSGCARTGNSNVRIGASYHIGAGPATAMGSTAGKC